LGSQNPVKQIISEIQKLRLTPDPNHFYIHHCPVPQRGVGQRHQRGAGCGGRGRCQRRRRCSRTAKSCGSDAPMLASSLREEAQATVSNKPGHRGDHEVRRKTIARGCRVISGVTVVTTLGAFFLSARGCGCIVRPAFPAPSDFRGERFMHSSGAWRGEIAKPCFFTAGCLKCEAVRPSFARSASDASRHCFAPRNDDLEPSWLFKN
jgi:hypothetical protein